MLSLNQLNLSKTTLKLLADIQKEGFGVRIVGGAIRDFFLELSNKIPQVDLEIFDSKQDHLLERKEALNILQNLAQSLGVNNVEVSPMGVLKGLRDGESIEISLPRQEEFTHEQGHKNFNPIFNMAFSFEDTISRRDFTINTMALEINLHKEVFLDPLGGVNDLKNRELRPAGEDFFRDPVRYARAVRFHLLYDLTFSPQLKLEIKKVELSYISDYHLQQEMFKSSRPLLFLQLFFRYLPSKSIFKSPLIQSFSSNQALLNNSKHLEEYILKMFADISIDHQKALAAFFKISVKNISRLHSFKKLQNKVSVQSLRANLESEFEEFLSSDNLENLTTLYKILNKDFCQWILSSSFLKLVPQEWKSIIIKADNYKADKNDRVSLVPPHQRTYFQAFQWSQALLK